MSKSKEPSGVAGKVEADKGNAVLLENGNKAGAKRDPMPRRAFIFRALSKEHRLTFRELREHFQSEIPYQTISDDVSFFCELGMEVEIGKDAAGEPVIIDKASRHDETTDVRRELQRREKRAIGNVGLGLICGIPPMLSAQERDNASGVVKRARGLRGKNTSLSEDELQAAVKAAADVERNARLRVLRQQLAVFSASPPDRSEIEEALIGKRSSSASMHGMARTSADQGNAAFKALEVFWKLSTFWQEHNRAIAMDAGTTNDAIAVLVRDLRLPMIVGSLERLTVCTNSRGIFNLLGVAKVLTKTIIIGGEQVARSEAVAGRMSELFVKSAGVLQFGLGIMGATVVDLDPKNLVACSDTAEEANLKTLLYGRSSLRILNVDHTKFRPDGQMRASYPFAAIHPDQLDLIITNAPLEPKYLPQANKAARDQNRAEWKKFMNSIDTVRRHGVPVLIARYHDKEESSLITELADFYRQYSASHDAAPS